MDESQNTPAASGAWNRLRRFWQTLRARWWSRWAIDLAIVAALFFAVTSYQTRNLADSGERMPTGELASLDGESQTLFDPEADRTLVYVWAPWCGVCSAETGTLNRATWLFGDDVAVRSIVFDYRSVEHARQSADEKGVEFPVLLGETAPQVREALNFDAYPTFYVLSDEGRVLTSTQGYTTTLGLVARVWL